MRLIFYELKKIASSRIICTIVLLLLAANVYTCAVYAKPQSSTAIPADDIEAFFEKYKESPEKVTADYKEYLDHKKQQEELLFEAIANEVYDFVPAELPNKYAGDGFSDGELYDILFDTLDNANNYSANIEKVIDFSRTKLIEYRLQNIPDDTYVVKYQNVFIATYKNLPNYVDIDFEYVRGWDVFLGYEAVNAFIFLSLIIICSVVFTQEKNSGILPILRTAKNGRAITAAAKMSAVLILTAIVVLGFTLSSFLTIGVIKGYSSPGNAIQSIIEFTYCPYVYTIGQFCSVVLFEKLLTFLLFSSAVTLLSLIFNSYVINYVSSLGLLGLNLLLNSIGYVNSDNVFKNLNLINASSVTPFYKNYPALNVFGNVVHYVPFMAFSFLFASLFLFVTVTVIYQRKGEVLRCNIRFPQLPPRIDIKNKLPKLPKRTTVPSLFSMELYKTFISSRMIWCVIILLALKIAVSYTAIQTPPYTVDGEYKNYMLYLSGELTDEKRDYVEKESEYINSILAQYNDMNEKYFSGSISSEDFSAYLREYKYANLHFVACQRVTDQLNYIDKLALMGDKAWFVYDTGWKTLLFTDFDPTLFAVILLLFSGVFSSEYNKKSSDGSFASILRTTKHGRKRTFAAKILSTAASALVITAVWNFTDLIFVLKTNTLCLPNAPVRSIMSFEHLMLDITILQYVFLFYAVRIFAAILLACIVCSLSALMKKIIPTVTASAAISLLPYLLSAFGLRAFEKFDYTKLSTATEYILNIKPMALFTLLIVSFGAFAVLKAEKEWNK